MNTLHLIRVALGEFFTLSTQASAGIAFRTKIVSYFDDDGCDIDAATAIRSGLLRFSVLWTIVMLALLIAGFRIPVEFETARNWILLVAVLMGAIVLIPAFLMTSPVAVLGFIISQAGKLPDAAIFEDIADRVPTARLWFTSFFAIVLFQTMLALLLATGIVHNNTALFPLFLIALIACVSAFAIGYKARFFARVALVAIAVIMLLWVAPSVRDAIYNKSHVSLTGSAYERGSKDALTSSVNTAVESSNVDRIKTAFENAVLDSDEEETAMNKLREIQCPDGGDVACVVEINKYGDEVRRLKSPPPTPEPVSVRTPPTRRGGRTPTPAEALSQDMNFSGLIDEIPSADLDRLREIFIFGAPDGSLDEFLLPYASSEGADTYELQDWEIDRANAGFKDYPNGKRRKTVIGSDWSPRVLTGGRDKFHYFVDGVRTWDLMNEHGQVILNAGNQKNFRDRSFIADSRWLKFRINKSDIDAGNTWVYSIVGR